MKGFDIVKQYKLIAKEFKKMRDPVDSENGHDRFICYLQADSIPLEILDWMGTNPREQKMTTSVANSILESLSERSDFHHLNRGVVFSVKKVDWDNKSHELLISFDNSEIQGNVDGGHTLRAIIEQKKKGVLSSDRYVFAEFFVGSDFTTDLASARNTSVQVDLKSIAELEKSFDVLKSVLKDLPFSNRIQYKMNEHYNDSRIKNPIDIREIIAILLLFSQTIYPITTPEGTLTGSHPIQSYSGKEASLKKFLKLGSSNSEIAKINRENMINHMQPIIEDVFYIWETFEINFAEYANRGRKKYGQKNIQNIMVEKKLVNHYFTTQNCNTLCQRDYYIH